MREREKVKQKTREKTSKKSKKDKLSFWFVCEIVFSLDVFWLAQKKKHKSRRQRHTKTQEVFGVPTRRKKSKKRRKKKKKNLSPPYFYIVSVVVVVVVVVVDSFFLSAFERERRRERETKKGTRFKLAFFFPKFSSAFV